MQSCRSQKVGTVKPGDSKPGDSKLLQLVNLLPLTKLTNHNINHMIDSKHLAILVNIFVPSKNLLTPGLIVLGERCTLLAINEYSAGVPERLK